jgi:putative PEP-CTERM system histidine kinase
MNWLSTLSGALVCLSYAIAAMVLFVRGRGTWPNRTFALAMLLTSAWGMVFVQVQSNFASPYPSDLFAALRDAAWISLLIVFVRQDAAQGALWRRFVYFGLCAVAAQIFFIITGMQIDTHLGVRLNGPLVSFFVSIFALVVIENLLRNVPHARRWSLKLLAIGLGALFGFNLLIIFPELLSGQTPDELIAAEPLLYIVVLPLFIVTAIRNETLRLQIHSSRAVAFHSATLLCAGLLLQGVAAAAYYAKTFGGTPELVLLVVLGFTAVIGFVAALSSQSVRSRLKLFINENFYTYKYDYRAEWAKFIQTLSSDEGSSGPDRVLKTLTNLLDSPGGILWVRRDGWRQFLPLAHWSLPEHFGPINSDERLLVGLEEGQLLELGGSSPSARDWKARFPAAWLAVPIKFRGRLLAFAILQQPRAPRKLDWEDRNLLGLIVLELGAHLVHEHTAQILAESQQLVEFNKRVTFALHDLKNAGGQLKLLEHNIEKFGHKPEFRSDMIATIRHVAGKLELLMDKLRLSEPTEGQSLPSDKPMGLVDLVAGVAAQPSNTRIVFSRPAKGSLEEGILVAAGLETPLEHVVANALDASPPGSAVEITVTEHEGTARVSVKDFGPGMSAQFIAESLFKPFHTTKPGGLGVGAYQARVLVRELGGELEVQSTLHAGTTVILTVPILGKNHSEAA